MIKMGYTPPDQDINDSVLKIIEGIDDFRLVAKNIRNSGVWSGVWSIEYRDQLVRMEKRLFDIEIELRELL